VLNQTKVANRCLAPFESFLSTQVDNSGRLHDTMASSQYGMSDKVIGSFGIDDIVIGIWDDDIDIGHRRVSTPRTL
jgi:hypothetical protein